jgi:hypothetical protein
MSSFVTKLKEKYNTSIANKSFEKRNMAPDKYLSLTMRYQNYIHEYIIS